MRKNSSTQSALYILLIITSLCNGCASKQEVPVLMYHEITDGRTPGDQTRISLQRFEEQMDWLVENNYNSLSLDELIACIQGARVPDKSFVLTIDDGWKSQLQILPVLRRHNFKAAFFVFPGMGIEDPYGDYLDWQELQGISDDPNFEVQAHSMTHPWDEDSNLVAWVEGHTPGKDRTDAEYELKQSKLILEQRLGVPVNYFAWPAGYFNETLIQMATDSGYQALFTIMDGATRPGGDRREIPRVFINGACELEGFKQTLREYREVPCQETWQVH